MPGYKEILENFIQPSQISPDILKRFLHFENEIREMKAIVKNCNSVLAAVKDFSPEDVYKSVADIEKLAKEEVEAMKNRFKQLEDKLMAEQQKLATHEDQAKTDF